MPVWLWWVVLVLAVFAIVSVLEWLEWVDARREADRRLELWLLGADIPCICGDCRTRREDMLEGA